MDNDTSNIAFADRNKPSFWLLHSVGWISYIIIFSFDNILFTYKDDVHIGVILALCISALIAALLTLPLRYIFQRCWHLNPKMLLITIAVSSLVVAALWTPTKNVVMWSIINDEMQANYTFFNPFNFPKPFALFTGLSYSFFMIFVWCNLYFGINYHYRLMNEKKMHLNAIRLSHHAQIKMLRYQINPHFLFNTLNAISTLVLQNNKEKANGMLTRLSTFLRFSLDNDPEKKIPLYDEIKAIMLYLEIEKTRFEDRLKIELKVTAEAELLYVPSLILQPLVENCIKHGIAKSPAGGTISINAECVGDYLSVCVSNKQNQHELSSLNKTVGNGKSSNGVGLKNIKDRLTVLYKNDYEFLITKSSAEDFKVDIKIPMEQA